MATDPAPTNSFPLDYTVYTYEKLEEEWNEYEFTDGLKIRVRVFLTRLVKQKNAPSYQISMNQALMTEGPPHERGQPSPPISNEELMQLPSYEIKPLNHTEPWNLYRIRATDELIRLKYVATKFSRVKDKFDQFGEPQVIVNGGPLPVIEPKAKNP